MIFTRDPAEKNNIYDNKTVKAEELLKKLKTHFKLT